MILVFFLVLTLAPQFHGFNMHQMCTHGLCYAKLIRDPQNQKKGRTPMETMLFIRKPIVQEITNQDTLNGP